MISPTMDQAPSRFDMAPPPPKKKKNSDNDLSTPFFLQNCKEQ